MFEFSPYLDPTKPLKTNHQMEYDYIVLPVIYASPAVVDIPDNLRAKIFSLFSKIGKWLFFVNFIFTINLIRMNNTIKREFN